MKTCQQCGLEFDPVNERPCHPAKYCSRRCRDDARRTLVTLTCVQCGQQFLRKAYMTDWSQERGPFCGFRCYAAWQSQHSRAQANPNYVPESHLVLTCDWCGGNFHRIRSYRGGQHSFCGRGCFEAFASEHFRCSHPTNYGQSWPVLRRRASERDNHRCRDCGSEEALVVHHLAPYLAFDFGPDAHELDNLLTVCRACHRARHNQLVASPR